MGGGYTESGVAFSNQTTSREAAETINLSVCRAAVFELFQKYGALADFELRAACRDELKWPLDRRICPRRNDLSKMGVLRDSGLKKINPSSNKRCIVWEITPADEQDMHKVEPEEPKRFMEVVPCPECNGKGTRKRRSTSINEQLVFGTCWRCNKGWVIK